MSHSPETQIALLEAENTRLKAKVAFNDRVMEIARDNFTNWKGIYNGLDGLDAAIKQAKKERKLAKTTPTTAEHLRTIMDTPCHNCGQTMPAGYVGRWIGSDRQHQPQIVHAPGDCPDVGLVNGEVTHFKRPTSEGDRPPMDSDDK